MKYDCIYTCLCRCFDNQNSGLITYIYQIQVLSLFNTVEYKILSSMHFKGLVNLHKNFFKTPIGGKASNERNRMSKAPSKIQK